MEVRTDFKSYFCPFTVSYRDQTWIIQLALTSPILLADQLCLEFNNQQSERVKGTRNSHLSLEIIPLSWKSERAILMASEEHMGSYIEEPRASRNSLTDMSTGLSPG